MTDPTRSALALLLALAALAAAVPCLAGEVGLGFNELLRLMPQGFTDGYGNAVDLSGDLFAIGEDGNGEHGPSTGAVRLYERNPQGVWFHKATFYGDDSSESFGRGVAAEARTLVVGAPTNGGGPGSAAVFERTGGEWVRTATLSPEDLMAGDRFGEEVALDGDTLAVAAPWHLDRTGEVWVFERDADDPGAWEVVARLEAGDPAARQGFGEALALDGDTLVVAAPFDDRDAESAGVVYVFERDPVTGDWAEAALLKDSEPVEEGFFGRYLDLDGDRLLVTTRPPDIPGWGYVFERAPEGDWIEVATLTAPDAEHSDWLGSSAALWGPFAALGAKQDDTSEASAGAIYFFVDRPGSGWELAAKLVNPSEWRYANFGHAIALDGGRLGVGVYNNSGLGQQEGGFVFALTLLAPELELFGACPGTVRAEASGVQARGFVEFWVGAPGGETIVDTGPCADRHLDLGQATRLREKWADHDGFSKIGGEVDDAFCDSALQVVDLTSCTATEALPLP